MGETPIPEDKLVGKSSLALIARLTSASKYQMLPNLPHSARFG